MALILKGNEYVDDPDWRCPRLLPDPEKRDPGGLVMCKYFHSGAASVDPTFGAGFCTDPDISKILFNKQCPTDGWT